MQHLCKGSHLHYRRKSCKGKCFAQGEDGTASGVRFQVSELTLEMEQKKTMSPFRRNSELRDAHRAALKS